MSVASASSTSLGPWSTQVSYSEEVWRERSMPSVLPTAFLASLTTATTMHTSI